MPLPSTSSTTPPLRIQHTPSDIECGVDEVARGCLLGRVYAGAVVWQLPESTTGNSSESSLPTLPALPKGIVIRDSKTMSRAQRERADAWIRQEAYAVAVAYRDEGYVDTHNIRQAAHDAMALAIREVNEQTHTRSGGQCAVQLALIDGDAFAPRGERVRPRDEVVPLFREPTPPAIPQHPHHPHHPHHSHLAPPPPPPTQLPPYHCVIKGDNTYFSIACAAIVAKVAHDRYIQDLCDAQPELDTRYDLRKNVGYGTAKHREGLRTYGPSVYHRRTFAGVKHT